MRLEIAPPRHELGVSDFGVETFIRGYAPLTPRPGNLEPERTFQVPESAPVLVRRSDLDQVFIQFGP